MLIMSYCFNIPCVFNLKNITSHTLAFPFLFAATVAFLQQAENVAKAHDDPLAFV